MHHSDKLSMCSSNSDQVMTPGVESGGTKSGQVHFGKAPTSLHMSTQTPASLFCRAARCIKSSFKHDCPFFTSSTAEADCTASKARIMQPERDITSWIARGKRVLSTLPVCL